MSVLQLTTRELEALIRARNWLAWNVAARDGLGPEEPFVDRPHGKKFHHIASDVLRGLESIIERAEGSQQPRYARGDWALRSIPWQRPRWPEGEDWKATCQRVVVDTRNRRCVPA